MRKLSKQEFIDRMLADQRTRRKNREAEHSAYVKERKADAFKKYKWPRKYLRG